MARAPALLGSSLAVLAVLATLAGCDLAFPIHDGASDGAAKEAGAGDAGASDAGHEASCTDDAMTLGSYVSEVVKDGPVVYLRLGESGGPTARDLTGNSDGAYWDAGVAYGAPGAILGDPDTAVQFDGNGRIVMPPGLDFQGMLPFTLEVWANEAPGNGYAMVLDHEEFIDAGAGFGSWVMLLNSGGGGGSGGLSLERWGANGLTSGSTETAPSAFPIGAYHHAVVTFDGTSLNVYQDAQWLGGTAGATSIPSTGMGWSIGGENCECSGGYIGQLDEVAVYPRALSAERICAHYLASGRR